MKTAETVEPLGAAVLVRPDPDSAKTEGGLLLTHATREIGKAGEVVEIGDDVTVELAIGDRVAFAGTRGASGFVGSPMDIDGVRHLVIQESDLLCVVEAD